MNFEDYKAGMVFEAGPRHVTEQEIVEFAQQYDPQWFHIDKVKAEKSHWGGLIASGWHTCAMAMRMAVESVLQSQQLFASPGLDKVRWLKPVRPGDALYLKGTVIAQRLSNSRPGVGIVLWSWLVKNQNNEVVLELNATSLFDLNLNSDD